VTIVAYQALVFATVALAGPYRRAVAGGWAVSTLVMVFIPWLALVQLFTIAVAHNASFSLEPVHEHLRVRRSRSDACDPRQSLDRR
jgi:hypothetical protein